MHMQLNRKSTEIISLVLIIFLMTIPASARIELTHFFSDFTTSDVTVNSDMDFQENWYLNFFIQESLSNHTKSLLM